MWATGASFQLPKSLHDVAHILFWTVPQDQSFSQILQNLLSVQEEGGILLHKTSLPNNAAEIGWKAMQNWRQRILFS